MAIATAPTVCPRCGRATESIRGRCPNCAFLKDPGAAPPVVERKALGGSIWDDLEGFGLIGLWVAPVVTLAILGLVFSLDVLLVIAAVVLLAPPAIRALVDWL